MANTELMIAEEFLLMGDANWRHELIRGELVQIPPANRHHSKLSMLVSTRLWTFENDRNLGVVTGPETGFTVARDPDVVLSPDASFVLIERLPNGKASESYFEGAPDLLAEIISCPDSLRYVNDKIMLYLESDAQLIWIIDPFCKIVTVYHSDRTAKILTTDDHLDGGEVLPGFRLAVSELFS